MYKIEIGFKGTFGKRSSNEELSTGTLILSLALLQITDINMMGNITENLKFFIYEK